jgi:hypothetical protein
MTELAVVDKGADGRRLKALVLDSVCSLPGEVCALLYTFRL